MRLARTRLPLAIAAPRGWTRTSSALRWQSSFGIAGDGRARDAPLLITTPIFYVNAAPHIGHVHSAVLADALARWHRLKGARVLLTTGTDEHGLKVQQAAERAGTRDVQAFCDAISTRFRSIFSAANVSFSRFIRTTDPDHRIAVEAIWRALVQRGHIYLGEHEGWYCQSDEAFLTDTQVQRELDAEGRPQMVSKESGHSVERVRESNYMFRLSAFQDRLLQWLDANPDVVVPASRFNHVRATIANGLRDISVSRLRVNVPWAIPVPDDPQHNVYVWLDALTNYITCAGYPQLSDAWPAAYHIVGKDILKFHAIYWPAFLMAVGLPLPRRIVSHAHWTVNHVKMSKSLGNVVDPSEVLTEFGTDAMRYFLLRGSVLTDDHDFSKSLLANVVHTELADKLGNLVTRSTAKCFLPDGAWPSRPAQDQLTEQDRDLIAQGQALSAHVEQAYEMPDFSSGIDRILQFLRRVNGFFSDCQPWVLRKRLQKQPQDISTQQRLRTVLFLSLDSIRVATLLLQPVIPASATAILDYLGVPSSQRQVRNAVVLDQDPAPEMRDLRVCNAQAFVPFKKSPPEAKRA